MTTNFKIRDNFSLTFQGRNFDLHNNFDFTKYEHRIDEGQLSLIWTKSSGSWVDANEIPKLTLNHFNISYLANGQDDKDYEYSQDDKCLDEISFVPSSERQNNNEMTLQDSPTDGDDILYIFESSKFIRIGCESIELVTEF